MKVNSRLLSSSKTAWPRTEYPDYRVKGSLVFIRSKDKLLADFATLKNELHTLKQERHFKRKRLHQKVTSNPARCPKSNVIWERS